MARTITIEVSDEEEKAVVEAVQPYRKQVSENPALLSLLYDIDLLPCAWIMEHRHWTDHDDSGDRD